MTAPLHVLVATPLGRGGKGGIDRMMDAVRDQLAAEPPRDMQVAFLTTRGPGHIAASPLYLATALARLALAKAAGEADLLHVNLSSHGSTRRKMILCRAARTLGVPYVLHLHGSRFRQYWDGLAPAKSAAVARMFAQAAQVVVLGAVWRDYVLAGTPDAQVTVLPNATPAPRDPRTGPDDGETRILFLGKIGQRKGVPDLIAALALIADQPGWRCVIAGDGEVEAARVQAAVAGLSHRIQITGWAGPDEVARLLAASDVLVLPSYDENLPMSVIEAMAHGLAVVATPVGAVEDIVTHEQTGLLADPGDVPALAAALRRLIDDPALRRRLGAAAQDLHARELEIVPYVRRLTQLWRAAAEGASA